MFLIVIILPGTCNDCVSLDVDWHVPYCAIICHIILLGLPTEPKPNEN